MKKGSVLGGVLLVSGSCIGAGMLALPLLTGAAGFIPSLAFFLLAWLFMVATSFLLLEANLSLGHELSLISLVHKTLGNSGRALCWFLFLFLFYSLNVAYISASGSLVHDIFHLPSSWGAFFFSSLFGLLLFFGVKPVDYFNRLLMAGLIVCYVLLVFWGSFHIDLVNLKHYEWKLGFTCLPVMILSFGFHNMIPTLTSYLGGDRKRLRLTLLIGSLLPLLFYFMWEAVMLGIFKKEFILEISSTQEIATSLLASLMEKKAIILVGQLFALFAITTSFLSQSFSLLEFLSDGLKVPLRGRNKLFLILITLAPPLLLASYYPGIFLRALQMAGGLAAVILFGVMPVLMVWILRYGGEKRIQVLPQGRLFLALVLVMALAIFCIELSQELGMEVFPHG